MTDRRPNDRFKNRFRQPRDGKTRNNTAHETDAHDAEDPNSEEEESCEEESDLTTAFEREMDETGLGGGRTGGHIGRPRRGRSARVFRVHV